MDIDVKTSISKQGYGVHNIENKIVGNKYELELEVALEDKVYPKMYYNCQPGTVVMDDTTTKIKAQELQIAKWKLPKDQQLMKLNLGTNAEPQLVKINAQLEISKVLEVEELLKEFKNVLHKHIKI